MRTHNYIVCGIVESVIIILDRRIAKYIFNVINSYNITVTSVITTFLDCESTVLQKIIDISWLAEAYRPGSARTWNHVISIRWAVTDEETAVQCSVVWGDVSRTVLHVQV